jgi:hypothetical protein
MHATIGATPKSPASPADSTPDVPTEHRRLKGAEHRREGVISPMALPNVTIDLTTLFAD